MATGPPAHEGADDLETRFTGALEDVTAARLVADRYLDALERAAVPSEPDRRDDVLLVVTELAGNAVQYAPGPFSLRLRRTFDGVHVVVRDSNPRPPVPRPWSPADNTGAVGWYLVNALATQVNVETRPEGKDVHVFLPW
ncbi:ATP-binding protein [Streptomyces fradiae]|uniref:ATP-binding protein n=1 Tax=Streptomyces fradiae TaxID=1906 RepID=UPI002941D453|nr:ATP-binding protein [Streptomyces fradiae]WOI61658.1 ATP-binding protein [Streptomyces fradiae]